MLEPSSTGESTHLALECSASPCAGRKGEEENNYFLPLHQNCFSDWLFLDWVNSCSPNAAFAFELLLWWSSLRQQS